MTYWLYQHLGNLSPEAIRSEGLLESLGQVDDGEQLLRDWAMQSEEFTSGGRQLPLQLRARCRTGPTGDDRLAQRDGCSSPGTAGWSTTRSGSGWSRRASADVDHLLIGTSLPAFVPGGLHDLQDWSEADLRRRLGLAGPKVRRMDPRQGRHGGLGGVPRLVQRPCRPARRAGERSPRADAPATISVLSGDIHFSYASEIRFPQADEVGRVHQLVSSPIRNALRPPESTAMRLAKSRFAAILGRVLRRGAGRRRPSITWKIDVGPIFANSLGELSFQSRSARLCILQACPHVDDAKPEFDELIEIDLVAGARSQAGAAVHHGA